MTARNNITTEKNKIVVRPLLKVATAPILIRKRDMFDLCKGESSGSAELSIKNIKFGSASALYKEDKLYDSSDGVLLWDSPLKVTIVNKFNLLTNSSRTTATFTEIQGKVSEKTSDQISKVIGQKNYDTVLAALCSGSLPEKVKIQAILALLKDTAFDDRGVQTENCDLKMEVKEKGIKTEPKEDKCCQTEEDCMDLLSKFKIKRKVKYQTKPYVIKDVPDKTEDFPAKTKKMKTANLGQSDSNNKRVIEDLDNKIKFETKDQLPEPESILPETESILPELFLNEESNDTDVMSNISISCNTEVLQQAEGVLLTSVDQRTMNYQPFKLALPDGSTIVVPVKPEDDFHIATPEILNYVPSEDRTKLLWYQAYIDWRRCLDRDADGFLPLHIAVLNKDIKLLKRQCVVLKTKNESLDITSGDNTTALQMSIMQDSIECTTTLLQYGADPLYPDEEHRATIHLAAEGSSDHLRAILNHCQTKAKDVLLYHGEELWKLEYAAKTDEELGAILVNHVCKMADSQGYTPLMLAAKMGNYTNVKMLVEASPECVNAAMPNCGNTALFLATAEACLDAGLRSNKSKVADHFHRTISILIESGADPAIPNYAGTSVNDLLGESCNSDLSMLFAHSLTGVKFHYGALPPANFQKFMLLKNEEGDLDLTDLKARVTGKNKRKNTSLLKETVKKTYSREKPKILENISLPVCKKVIIDPKSIIKGDVKLISPKDKLVTVKTESSKLVSPTDKLDTVKSASESNTHIYTHKLAGLKSASQSSLLISSKDKLDTGKSAPESGTLNKLVTVKSASQSSTLISPKDKLTTLKSASQSSLLISSKDQLATGKSASESGTLNKLVTGKSAPESSTLSSKDKLTTLKSASQSSLLISSKDQLATGKSASESGTLISPKDKLVTVKTESDIAKKRVTIVPAKPNVKYISAHLTLPSKVPGIIALPAASAVTDNVGSQTVKRKTVSDVGPSEKKVKDDKTDGAGVVEG